jgi:Ni/Co efflux regulator RcnB
MKFTRTIAVSTALTFALSAGMAFAQDHRDDHQQPDHYVHHTEWKKGYHMQPQDWNRGQQVDWHSHHLRQPPRGYEWRQVDGNYVLAGIATGIIASTIIAAGR